MLKAGLVNWAMQGKKRNWSYNVLTLHVIGITNCVDHVSGGGTPGSTVMCELARNFHTALYSSCVAGGSICQGWVVD